MIFLIVYPYFFWYRFRLLYQNFLFLVVFPYKAMIINLRKNLKFSFFSFLRTFRFFLLLLTRVIEQIVKHFLHLQILVLYSFFIFQPCEKYFCLFVWSIFTFAPRSSFSGLVSFKLSEIFLASFVCVLRWNVEIIVSLFVLGGCCKPYSTKKKPFLTASSVFLSQLTFPPGWRSQA